MNKVGSLLIFLGSLGVLSPSLSGLYPLILIATIIVGAYLVRNLGRPTLLSFSLLSFLTLGFSLTGFVSIELASVVFASGLIAYFFPKLISFALLLVFSETPIFQILSLLIDSKIPPQFELSATVITLLLLSTIIFTRSLFRIAICTLAILFSSYINWWLNIDVLFASIINAVIFGLFFISIKNERVTYPKLKFYSALSLLLAHSLFIWFSSSRIDSNRVVVWLPSSIDKYESQFFKDYSYTLSLAGIKSKLVSNVSDIEKDSLVIVPWSTDIEADQFLSDLKKSPVSSYVTVLVGGEHTNYNGFADRLNPIFGGGLWFDNTTTVPPGNANAMGALWTGSILQFPFDATFNRGASLGISSLAVFPILVAKSIFTDYGPREFNDFWVGDFLLGHSDRRGSMLLMAAYRDGPLWVLSGDNSYLMNRYLLPNPAPVLHAISLSTLLPLLILQIWLLITAFVWGIHSNQGVDLPVRSRFIFFLPLVLLVLIAIPLEIQTTPDNDTGKALFKNLKFFGGDERSSAIAISANSKIIVDSQKKLFVHEIPFSSSDIGRSGLAEIHIGHLKDGFLYAGVKIDNCGLTSYTNKVDPKINFFEAQYCRVSGDAKIIAGDSNQASVIQINSNPTVILILDKYFLAGSPPASSNTEYLQQLLNGPNSR